MEIAATPTTEIHEPLFAQKEVRVFIKREDLNHPIISGNKWRKLKYNLAEAKKRGHKTLLTFGGAFSNHIYAVAGAGKEFGFETIGVIRGEEHATLNATLSFATQKGMLLHYVDRQAYRNKASREFQQNLEQKFGDFYLIPEGGTNDLAIKGCSEIISEIESSFDVLCCPVGTGGTLAGLISGLNGTKTVMGFSSLKGDFLKEDVKSMLSNQYDNWKINADYHFGGYAKVKPELLDFILGFESRHQIPLEPIYTGKMLFGIYDLIKKGFFEKGSKIIALHTGGLQGNAGFDFRKSLEGRPSPKF